MKKILFAIITIVAINACNSPQRMTGPNGDTTISAPMDTSTKMQSDTARKDSM